MKTAVSVPDDIYAHAERVAKTHGLNRSQFYSIAVKRYADELESAELTSAIDAVVELVNADESTASAVSAGRRAIAADDESW
ncbi:MAG: CopG family transcriptional regulator [Austwickia sp.]|nr:CopG family transcriptional regulator [Actinomycetota bacterium]MCB1301893.1 CopG family transcriptional regulator [Tetrasphaera sp.]MCO5310032.1 CopG family transcriptional regulator [Austwickia sp.]